SLARFARPAARIVIDNVTPSVDDGRFPAKCVVGDAVAIAADIFMDGHGVLAAELLWQALDEETWSRERMQPLGNDRWQATIRPARIGRYVFKIEAWPDAYGTFCRDLEIKRKAGVDISLDVKEGLLLLQDAIKRARAPARAVLSRALDQLASASIDTQYDILLSQDVRQALAGCEDRHVCARLATAFPIDVERPQARFASWYELF